MKTTILLVKKDINEFFPVKRIKLYKHKHKMSKWITKRLIGSIAFRDKLYLKLKSVNDNNTPHGQLKTNLQCYNSLLKKLIRKAKLDYYCDKFELYKNYIKNTRETIKEVIERIKTKPTLPDCFTINNERISDKNKIVNEFNSYFAHIGPKLASNICPPFNKHFSEFLQNILSNTLNFSNATDVTISTIINTLKPKSSTGYDRLFSKLLKRIKNPLIPVIVFLINQSLNSGIFPDSLKIAKILPIYKKDDEHILSNYRPISPLPVISKVFEKAIFKRLHEFFKLNNVYYDPQYGFRESHSTEHAVLELSYY